jgi:hypothetical protein
VSTHARLSPSNTRWPVCPGSVREEEKYPDIPGEAAIDGTGSHLQLELCFQNSVQASAYDGELIGLDHPDRAQGWIVDADRSERVQMCLDYVTRRVVELNAEFGADTDISVESESKSNPGALFGRTDWNGTCDVTITVTDAEYNCLFIETIDYKDGRGYVNVENNTQLLSYLGGKIRPFISAGAKITDKKLMQLDAPCRMTIVQPKTNPPVRYEDHSVSYVIDAITDLAIKAELTDNPEAPLVPDDKAGKGHCSWCKHKQNCTALANVGASEMKNIFEVVNSSVKRGVTSENKLWELLDGNALDVSKMSEKQLGELSDTKASVLALFEKIDTEIERRLNAGQSVDGFAMLPGNGSNKWNATEEEVKARLKEYKVKKDDMYVTSFVSPAQALKLPKLSKKQKEELAEDMISHVKGKKKLTKVARNTTDQPTVEDMFGNINKNVVQSKTNVVQLNKEISFI